LAADTSYTLHSGWGEWWLPKNYAKHGGAIDGLFNGIFWLTMIVMVVVEIVLVVFCIKYRHNPAKAKGKFIHGNTRLEMIWTLIPAVILAIVALASKHVWDRYRYAEEYDNSPQTEVMVIGEQFQWNFVYPGKDKQFGQYLAFPHASDAKFRSKKYEDAQAEIVKEIIENPLGQNKNWEDKEAEHGKDDDYDRAPGRPLILPVERPIAVRLSSKDVIHDFFLPNFRVKLDALPGMSGRLNFTAMREAQSTEDVDIGSSRLTDRAKEGEGKGYKIWIDSNTPTAIKLPSEEVSQISYALNGVDEAGNKVQIASRQELSLTNIANLKRAGVKKVTIISKPFELVCEELCGAGHTTMRGEVWMVSGPQYDAFREKGDPDTGPNRVATGIKPSGATTQPSIASTR
jgi:heme/copper-type cytochrome/quinol oxidase subunit 2